MYYLLVVAILLWSMNILIMKEMIQYVPFLFLASIRLWMTTILLFLLCLLTKQKIRFGFTKQIIKSSIYIIVINFIMTFWGMQTVTGSNVSIINGFSPFITNIYTKQRKGKERITLLAFLFMCGAFLIGIYPFQLTNCLAILFVFVGLFSYCYGTTTLKNVEGDQRFCYTFLYQLFGSIVITICAFLFQGTLNHQLDQVPIGLLLLFVFVSGIGFGYIQLVLLYCVQKISSVKTNAFFAFTPIVTFLMSILVNPELFSIKMMVSLLCLACAILLLVFKQ